MTGRHLAVNELYLHVIKYNFTQHVIIIINYLFYVS